MKKAIVLMSVTLCFWVVSCQNSEKEADGNQMDSVAENVEPEVEVYTDTVSEYNKYKIEVNEKIQKNEEKIAELKVKIKDKKGVTEVAYQKRIDRLEKKNEELKQRLNDYKEGQSNWEEFKREFNRDMDELGEAINDLGEDNAK